METTAQLERQLRRDMAVELNRLINLIPGGNVYEQAKALIRVNTLEDRSRELDKTRLD